MGHLVIYSFLLAKKSQFKVLQNNNVSFINDQHVWKTTALNFYTPLHCGA